MVGGSASSYQPDFLHHQKRIIRRWRRYAQIKMHFHLRSSASSADNSQFKVYGNNPFNLHASVTRLIAIVYAAVR
jgi:hypothetical protein